MDLQQLSAIFYFTLQFVLAGSGEKFRIRPDPDPQQWILVLTLLHSFKSSFVIKANSALLWTVHFLTQRCPVTAPVRSLTNLLLQYFS